MRPEERERTSQMRADLIQFMEWLIQVHDDEQSVSQYNAEHLVDNYLSHIDGGAA